MDQSGDLRKQIAISSERYAKMYNLPYYKSLGKLNPTIMFEPFYCYTRHGNFIDASYRAILENPSWAVRLGKRHQKACYLPECKRKQAKELDSSNSSDALLMNIFCYPNVLSSKPSELFHHSVLPPEFGVRVHIPLSNGKGDATEIDMRLGDIIVEAKFTEKDFTSKDKNIVRKYKDFDDIFNEGELSQTETKYHSYQLIRNILAAHHYNYFFFLLCDKRRPDLLEEYNAVHNAIKYEALRSRCKVIFWQDIASVISGELKVFLSEKYGIKLVL
jgi:hypothetical protein